MIVFEWCTGKLPLEAVEEFAATQASAVQRITQVRQTAAAVLDEVSVEGAESSKFYWRKIGNVSIF